MKWPGLKIKGERKEEREGYIEAPRPIRPCVTIT